DHHWREALDPGTKQIYYYNEQTKKTSWDRPAEMGETVHATGWFGRGKAGAQSRLDEQNREFLSRTAPKQVEAPKRETAYLQGADSYNIWYGRHVGEQWSHRKNYDPAEHRCNLKLHAGRTRADKRQGGANGQEGAFCIKFAKGACPDGSKFRSHAEFAKEAMANQTLDHDEILNVNWAHEDPNPVAQEAIKRSNADAVIAAIKASGGTVGEQDTKFAVPADYDVGLRLARELLKGTRLDDALLPSGHGLVDHFDIIERLDRARHGSRRKELSGALLFIRHADLELVQFVQDVELGDVERRVAVYHVAVLHQRRVKPAASPLAARGDADFAANFLEVSADL
ncbi:Pre-mRNA-splicing factor CWC2, partial [Durusdinium trenchii]